MTLEYSGFSGTLPDIGSINFEIGSFGMMLNGLVVCTGGVGLWGWLSNPVGGISVNLVGGRVSTVTFNATSIPRRVGSGLFCPMSITVTGTLFASPVSVWLV
ncbi:hypothetical protein [Conexibacter arvalis]|uniref:Uncharacterized protein n=1 Tax=Conexibacter arvalis TaxID=912552 RepID=A0A840ILE2_9ACTN|nr:hypothetical protein [Conexibacter arvalis]MBB4665061.1 hypothetical protein [Conexibacter arvalis]